MKKAISLLLSLLLIVFAAGCSTKTEVTPEAPSDPVTTPEKPEETPQEPEKSTAYYDYAVAHDEEFWSVNQNWRDDREYYYLADIDHDGQQEMVVKIGCGIGVYKEVDGVVEEVFRDTLPDSSGSVNYWVAKYDHKDYIIYTSASSSEYRVLYTVKDGKLTEEVKSLIINFTDYNINDRSVSEADYNSYIDSIEYPSGIEIDGLK